MNKILERIPDGSAQSGASSFPTVMNGSQLLNALWPSSALFHQIGAMDRHTKKFWNIQVSGVNEAYSRAPALSEAGTEAYFACAEYLTPNSREAANVSGASGFWMDIDCGDEKAAAGKGYATVYDAEVAVRQFCKEVGLPQPTHIVYSGAGLQVYWVLDATVDRENWQRHAGKLKELTTAHGLLADGSRTADIASVLRIPGTLNHKYLPPRRVFLRYASVEFIARSAMLGAIDSVHGKLRSATAITPPGNPATVPTPEIAGNGSKFKYGQPNLAKLASALAALEPDCDDETWKLRRLAPMADAAREYPELSAALYALATSWSCGELGGIASIAWRTPGGNGLTGEEAFDPAWERFLTGKYTGKPTTLATIYYDAAQAGWVDPDERFANLPDEAKGGA